MKNKTPILIVILTSFLLLHQSCEKTTEILDNDETSSIAYECFVNEVTEQIVITDATGQNEIVVLVYADSKSSLDQFLTSYDLSLVSDIDSYPEDVFRQTELPTEKKKARSQFNVNEEPRIYLRPIYSSLKNDETRFLVNLSKKMQKSASYIPGYPIGWITSGDFLGTVHYGHGSEYLVQWRIKLHWYSSWQYIMDGDIKSWFVYPSGAYYRGYQDIYDSYRLQMIIRPDIYQTEVNYLVAYDLEDMYGHDCAVGSYDSRNCYIGTAPTGTNAFFYTYGSGNTWAMYSPVNGNQCPLSGSVFDGANCKYVQIPNDSESFIHNNKWYIKPENVYQ